MNRISKENKFSTRKFTLKNWLTIFGSVIIFASWIAEKKFKSEWKNEIERLNLSQLIIEIAENRKHVYEIAYLNETQSERKDTSLIAFYEQKLIRTFLDLFTWSKGRISNDSEEKNQLINEKRKIVDVTRDSLIAGNYKVVNQYFIKVFEVMINDYSQLDNQFFIEYDRVKRNERIWTNIFISFYILGSVLLGTSYIVGLLNRKE